MQDRVGVNENPVGQHGKFGGKLGQVAHADFDFRVEGVERIRPGEKQGGGSTVGDGLRSEREQDGWIRVGDQGQAGSGWEAADVNPHRADQVQRCAGRKKTKGRVRGGHIYREPGLKKGRREEGQTKVRVGSGGQTGEDELAGGRNQVRFKANPYLVANQFQLFTTSFSLSHAAMITQMQFIFCG